MTTYEIETDTNFNSNCCHRPIVKDTETCSNCLEHCTPIKNDKMNQVTQKAKATNEVTKDRFFECKNRLEMVIMSTFTDMSGVAPMGYGFPAADTAYGIGETELARHEWHNEFGLKWTDTYYLNIDALKSFSHIKKRTTQGQIDKLILTVAHLEGEIKKLKTLLKT